MNTLHPEDFCVDCGRRNISWHVNSPMWNKLVREPVGHDPMICPACFVLRAEKQGVMATWEIAPVAATLKGWPK